MTVNKQLKNPSFRFTTYKNHRKYPKKLRNTVANFKNIKMLKIQSLKFKVNTYGAPKSQYYFPNVRRAETVNQFVCL